MPHTFPPGTVKCREPLGCSRASVEGCGLVGPYDDLVAALDHAADLFGDRKVVMWCMEWAIARNPDPAIFACEIDESGGVAEELGLLEHNPEPIRVVDVKTCSTCNMRAPWCSCGRADYR